MVVLLVKFLVALIGPLAVDLFTFLNEFLFTGGASFSIAHEYSLRNPN